MWICVDLITAQSASIEVILFVKFPKQNCLKMLVHIFSPQFSILQLTVAWTRGYFMSKRNDSLIFVLKHSTNVGTLFFSGQITVFYMV